MTEKTVKVGETVYTHEIRGWTKQYPGSMVLFMVDADTGAILTALYEAKQEIAHLKQWCIDTGEALAKEREQNAKLVEFLENLKVQRTSAEMDEGESVEADFQGAWDMTIYGARQTLKEIESLKAIGEINGQ